MRSVWRFWWQLTVRKKLWQDLRHVYVEWEACKQRVWAESTTNCGVWNVIEIARRLVWTKSIEKRNSNSEEQDLVKTGIKCELNGKLSDSFQNRSDTVWGLFLWLFWFGLFIWFYKIPVISPKEPWGLIEQFMGTRTIHRNNSNSAGSERKADSPCSCMHF